MLSWCFRRTSSRISFASMFEQLYFTGNCLEIFCSVHFLCNNMLRKKFAKQKNEKSENKWNLWFAMFKKWFGKIWRAAYQASLTSQWSRVIEVFFQLRPLAAASLMCNWKESSRLWRVAPGGWHHRKSESYNLAIGFALMRSSFSKYAAELTNPLTQQR